MRRKQSLTWSQLSILSLVQINYQEAPYWHLKDLSTDRRIQNITALYNIWRWANLDWLLAAELSVSLFLKTSAPPRTSLPT